VKSIKRLIMKKKLFILLGALLLTLTANAQFEANKTYINGSLSGLNLGYNGKEKLQLGAQAQVGRLVADNLMILGQAGYEHTGGNEDAPDRVMVGAGFRYYIIQNGFYLGANAKLVHATAGGDFKGRRRGRVPGCKMRAFSLAISKFIIIFADIG
jgi:hypothetical protein